MKQCTDYEVELSAMLDGESDPATAVELLDHLALCSSCRFFYQELRSFQAKVDRIATIPEPQPVTEKERRRGLDFGGFMPRWAWGLAAVCIIAIGLWWGGVFERSGGVVMDLAGRDLTVVLEENKGAMDDGRFVELVVELLRADRRYQDEMYVVLNQIKREEVRGESPVFEGRSEGSNAESCGEMLAVAAGQRVLY